MASKIKKVKKKIQEGFLKEVVFELRWIFSRAAVYKAQILLYSCLNLSVVLISMFFSVKIKDVVDMLINQNWKEVLILAFIYMIVGTFNVLLSICKQRMSALVATRVKKDLTYQTYQNTIDAEWEKINMISSGDMITRLNDDINTVSSSVVGWIPDIIVQGIQLVFAVCCILYYDSSMLLMILVAAPIIVLGSRIFLGKVYEKNKEQKILNSEITSFEKETFQNIHTIKAFALSNRFSEKMMKLQEKRQTLDLQANKYSVASWTVMYLSGQIAALICLIFAVYHVYTGVITLGIMTMMAVMASIVSTSFKSLINIIPTAMNTIASSARIRELLALVKEENIDEEKSVELLKAAQENGINMIVDDISFTYKNGKEVFVSSSFHASPNEIIALVGPSGEGKTTLLRILLGIVKTQSGKAYIQIHNQENLCMKIGLAIRKMIAYVPQGNTILSGTIAENMRIVRPDATDEEIIDALKKSCAYEFVEKLPGGIEFSVGESGIGFSEGQNQRLAIARALLCKAPILLLDEATSALDVTTERKVLRNLMDGKTKRTCILTTHRPSVLSLCNRVYKINDKRITVLNEQEIEQLSNDF